jgi:hypothetical protein
MHVRSTWIQFTHSSTTIQQRRKTFAALVEQAFNGRERPGRDFSGATCAHSPTAIPRMCKELRGASSVISARDISPSAATPTCSEHPRTERVWGKDPLVRLLTMICVREDGAGMG